MACSLFLLAGQSNASGNGDPFDESLDAEIVPGVWQWDSVLQRVEPAVSPLKHHTAPRRVGFGYHFGVLYHRTTGREVVLIPRGRDGSRFRDGFWMPGAPGGEGLEDAIRQSNAAIAATGGIFRGTLWHQGEADTQSRSSAREHLALLALLIETLRTRINGARHSIFLCGGMVPSWVAETPAAQPIQEALEAVANCAENAGYVSSDGLSGNKWAGDSLHFNAKSQRLFGLRYLDAYLAIAGDEPDPVSALAVEAPGEAVLPARAAPAPGRRFSLVACARWENDDIVEWIEYHRAIGIEHFYIYSNDDSPVPLFKVLSPYLFAENPIITYRHWPKTGQQPHIYFHFMENFLHETEWFSFLDIDEFLVFKNIDSIAVFMSRFEHSHDAIYLNWLIYGNNNLEERDGDSILFSHTRRAARIDHHTKVITRAAAVNPALVRKKLEGGAIGFWHFWNDYEFADSRLANALGGRVTNYTKGFPNAAIEHVRRPGVSDAMINTAYVAHFQFKSEQDFVRRAERGGFPIASLWGQAYADGSYKKILAGSNTTEDFYLAAFWARRCGSLYNTAALHPVPPPKFENIALRKPSTQSSRYPGPVPEPNAFAQGHGNDGFRSGTFGFHTQMEDAPWWKVDFLGQYVIREIHVYNRAGEPAIAARANHIAIEVSTDDEGWERIFVYEHEVPFGNVNSKPLIVRTDEHRMARYLRIIATQPTILHLDEVEVYGFRAV